MTRRQRDRATARRTVWVFEDSGKIGFGGGQRVTSSVLHALRDQRVRLIDSSAHVWDRVRPIHPGLRLTLVPFRGKSVRATSSFSFPASEIVLSVVQLVRAFLRVSPLVRREHPDVLYCASRKGFVLALLLRLFAGARAPIVFHAHTALPSGMLPRLFAGVVARSSEVVLCVSRFVFDQMRGRRVLLPNPLEGMGGPVPRAPRQRRVVGFVGSLQPIKGFDLFVEVARARGDRFDFRAFMPEGPRRQDPSVEVWRGLSGADIYREMDVLLICSRAPESFSLVALEAAASDVPVVFPPHPALLELLVPGKSGEMYDPQTVPAIRDSLDRVMERLDTYHPREAVDMDTFDPERFESSIRRIVLTC